MVIVILQVLNSKAISTLGHGFFLEYLIGTTWIWKLLVPRRLVLPWPPWCASPLSAALQVRDLGRRNFVEARMTHKEPWKDQKAWFPLTLDWQTPYQAAVFTVWATCYRSIRIAVSSVHIQLHHDTPGSASNMFQKAEGRSACRYIICQNWGDLNATDEGTEETAWIAQIFFRGKLDRAIPMPRLPALDDKPAMACFSFRQVDLELTHIDRGLVPVGMHRTLVPWCNGATWCNWRGSRVVPFTGSGGVLHIWCHGLWWPGAMRVPHPKAVEAWGIFAILTWVWINT
jgi:hypothetical protein